MRRFVVPLLALCALAIPASAVADGGYPPETQPVAPTLLPAPTPPGTVTDEAGAGVFAKAFLIAHAGDLVPGARALAVDVPACRQVDAVARFYCLATARLATVQQVTVTRYFRASARHKGVRSAGDDDGDWSSTRDGRHTRRVRVNLFRVRLFSCVAVVRIVGGPTVTPSATLPVRDCVRVNRTGSPTPY